MALRRSQKVASQGFFEEFVRVVLREVCLAVLFGDACVPAAYHNAFAALVEDLRDAGEQCLLVQAAVETDADVTHGQLGAGSWKAPALTPCALARAVICVAAWPAAFHPRRRNPRHTKSAKVDGQSAEPRRSPKTGQ